MEMLDSYLKQIQRFPLLDANQEAALSREIEKGNKAAENQLVNSNLRLVVSIAKKFGDSSKVSMMDLIQEGNMGLMTAAAKFHYGFNTRFSTYAYTWILQYMLRYLYNKTSLISLPHRKEELLRKVTLAQTEYKQTLNREPTLPELAEYTGVSEEDVAAILAYSYSVTSIDIETSDDGSSTIGDLIPDNKYNPEETFLREEKRSQVMEMVDSLPENEKKVIYCRYNFACDQHVPTLRELSTSMGVSAETVRQIEMRAVKKIRKAADSVFLRDFVTA